MELYLFELVFFMYCSIRVQTGDVILMYWRHITVSYRITDSIIFVHLCVLVSLVSTWKLVQVFLVKKMKKKKLQIICYLRTEIWCHIKRATKKLRKWNQLTMNSWWQHGTRLHEIQTYGNLSNVKDFTVFLDKFMVNLRI